MIWAVQNRMFHPRRRQPLPLDKSRTWSEARLRFAFSFDRQPWMAGRFTFLIRKSLHSPAPVWDNLIVPVVRKVLDNFDRIQYDNVDMILKPHG